jgi:hypothetical protein
VVPHGGVMKNLPILHLSDWNMPIYHLMLPH